MGEAATNRDRYATTDFEKWAGRRELFTAEEWLIDRYLSRDKPTLDAGTGGGSIVFAMRDMGFTSVAGFDNVPEMVSTARSRDPAGTIRFDVMDATDLGYEDDSFDQLVYLQWLISLVEGADGRTAALREAYRVLRSGGVALFSLASWDTRQHRATVKAVGTWLRALRAVRRTDRTTRDWPHLRAGGRRNYGALLDRGPYLHWFTKPEATTLLEQAGFSVVLSAREPEVTAMAGGEVYPNAAGLYLACTKP